MNNKKQLKISGWIIAVIIIIVVAAAFLIVQVRFIQNYDGYIEKHESATSKINYYNSYLSNASAVESEIASMIDMYQTKNPILFSNATKTPNEIRTVLKNLKYDITTLSISTGVDDDQGRQTLEGGKLMLTSISFQFTGSSDDLKKTLDYLELKADGAYYINEISIAPHEVDSGSASASSVAGTGKGTKYDFDIQMSLYYFEKVDVETVIASESSESSAA